MDNEGSVLDALISLSVQAGLSIMELYDSSCDIRLKHDRSVVTQADFASHDIICSGLRHVFPDVPVQSEEGTLKDLSHTSSFFLVDPLDGTLEFIKKNGDFTTNIALIKNQTVVCGVIFAPFSRELFYAVHHKGAFLEVLSPSFERGIPVRLKGKSILTHDLIVLVSRNHLSAKTRMFVNTLDSCTLNAVGSSLKFCRLAEGKAHLYPRFGRTMEWDTVAGQIILEEAGGMVLNVESRLPLTYRKKNWENPHFLAWSTRDFPQDLVSFSEQR